MTKLLIEVPAITIYLDIDERELEVVLNAVIRLGIGKQQALRGYYTNYFNTLSTFDICSVHIKKK